MDTTSGCMQPRRLPRRISGGYGKALKAAFRGLPRTSGPASSLLKTPGFRASATQSISFPGIARWLRSGATDEHPQDHGSIENDPANARQINGFIPLLHAVD